jgi:hypothetical protein
MFDIKQSDLRHPPLPRAHKLSASGQKRTDCTRAFCHTASHDNSNDSRILRGRTAKSFRYSAANGRRSRAHTAVAAWGPSYGETAQTAVGTSNQSGNQKENKEKDGRGGSQETTRRGKEDGREGNENPQEGLTHKYFAAAGSDCCANSGCLPCSPDGLREPGAIRIQGLDGLNRIQHSEGSATTQHRRNS